ncbi:hypothetical protein GOP47_0020559 [Adiantum capillus-veneris]|uniref:Epidermal patterning factor-like protein n=1 Tax=Adiantum capillus-veneris TaxID=13818 RepID=A0A9D4U9C1_ADICA|nr:hypothetical protein GOP47_0020559 [Adiantum capillus-veneris]
MQFQHMENSYIRRLFFLFITTCILLVSQSHHAIPPYNKSNSRRELPKVAKHLYNTSSEWRRTVSQEVMGSIPRSCSFAKCNGCVPCRPIQMRVDPTGNSKTMGSSSGTTSTGYDPHAQDDGEQYYPQAWRCQCKGKFYMP